MFSVVRILPHSQCHSVCVCVLLPIDTEMEFFLNHPKVSYIVTLHILKQGHSYNHSTLLTLKKYNIDTILLPNIQSRFKSPPWYQEWP